MNINIAGVCMDCSYELLGTVGTHDEGKYSLGFRCDHCGFVIEIRLDGLDGLELKE